MDLFVFLNGGNVIVFLQGIDMEGWQLSGEPFDQGEFMVDSTTSRGDTFFAFSNCWVCDMVFKGDLLIVSIYCTMGICFSHTMNDFFSSDMMNCLITLLNLIIPT